MGRLILLELGPVYIDANATIYRFEGIETVFNGLGPVVRCPPGPEDTGRNERVDPAGSSRQTYQGWEPFARIDLSKNISRNARTGRLEIDRDVLELAAQIRADYRLKTPDAIHAATGMLSHVSIFLTNDREFRKVPGLNVVLLDEIAATESN